MRVRGHRFGLEGGAARGVGTPPRGSSRPASGLPSGFFGRGLGDVYDTGKGGYGGNGRNGGDDGDGNDGSDDVGGGKDEASEEASEEEDVLTVESSLATWPVTHGPLVVHVPLTGAMPLLFADGAEKFLGGVVLQRLLEASEKDDNALYVGCVAGKLKRLHRIDVRVGGGLAVGSRGPIALAATIHSAHLPRSVPSYPGGPGPRAAGSVKVDKFDDGRSHCDQPEWRIEREAPLLPLRPQEIGAMASDGLWTPVFPLPEDWDEGEDEQRATVCAMCGSSGAWAEWARWARVLAPAADFAGAAANDPEVDGVLGDHVWPCDAACA